MWKTLEKYAQELNTIERYLMFAAYLWEAFYFLQHWKKRKGEKKEKKNSY